MVPVYQTSSAEECRYVLAHSGARVVICEDAAQLGKLERIRRELPALARVLTMDPVDGVMSLRDVRARGAASSPGRVEAAMARVGHEDVATIVYTSGTTGPPKGCELTHGNLLTTVRMYESQLELGPGVVIFMFLPLAHALARVVQLVALDVGATLSFLEPRPEAAARRPRGRASDPFPVRAPAVREGSRQGARERRGRLGRTPADLPLGRRDRRADAGCRAARGSGQPDAARRHRLADRLVLAKVRQLFGGALQLGLTGAAPIGRDVLEFFDACGLLVLEGYGMTETCAAATLNTPDSFRFGTVGRALPGCEIEIAEDGEVLLGGPLVFRGYRDDPDATAATFTGGWLRTGDLGAMDAHGFLSITGRKKDLIITSSGKNITPSNLETALRESRWIAEAVVFGDNRPYLVALLTLDRDELAALADRTGAEPTHEAMADDPRVLAEIQAVVDAVNARVARIEQIKRFDVLDHELSQDGGELTPTMKVKRAAVAARYRDLLDRLYA